MRYLQQSFAILLLSVTMLSCSEGQVRSADGPIAENVDVKTFAEHLKDAQVLDVRTPGEWSQGIIEGAVMNNLFSDDFKAQLGKLDKEKPVAVYCKSGGRSGKAMSIMKSMGFKEIYNLNGGMMAWQSAHQPTTAP